MSQLAEQTLYKTYHLTPTDSEFNIRENGTVELKVTYYGIQQHYQNEPINRIFPENLLGSNDPEMVKAKEKIKKLRARARREDNKRKKEIIRRDLEKEILFAQTRSEASFLDGAVSKLFEAFMNPNLYHRTFIPKAFLGIRSKDRRVVKWSPYQSMSFYEHYVPNKTHYISLPNYKTKN